MKQLHRVFYLASVLLVFLPFWPILYFLRKDSSKNYSYIVRIRKIIANLSSAVSGISYKIKLDENVDWNRHYIICANHTSNLDITAVIKVAKTNFSFIGKEELLNNPVTRLFFKSIDIPVNRSSKLSSFKAFKLAQQYLLEGKSIAIFPEGGIADEYPPKLLDFKNGGFKLAVDLGIPVLPVIIQDAWKLHWDDGKKYGSKPGKVHIQILKPVETKELNLTANELRDYIFELFNKNLKYSDNDNPNIPARES